jgi:CRP-like cAMP-binding protein
MKQLPASPAEKFATLRNNIYFEGLDDDALLLVAKGMHLYQFARKESIFLEAEACAGLHIMKSGSAKVFLLSPQGRQYIVKILYEGDTFNEVSVYGGGENPVNTAALEKSEIWIINSQILQKLVSSYPNYANQIINNLSNNLRNLVRRVSGMAFFQVTHRLAQLLNELPEEALNGENNTRLTQDQLAARLGSVREVIARSLRALERSEAIHLENRRIYIVDREKLAQLANGMWE